jgi:hypothetical protein
MTRSGGGVAKGEPFFLVCGYAMLAITCAAFILRGLLRPDSLPPFTAVVTAHGVVMVAWLALFISQATLVRTRRVPVHRRLGRLSVVLAVAVVLTGLAVTVSGFGRSGDGPTSLANSTSILTFAALYVLALRNTRAPMAHKRYLLLASLRMLAPAYFRLTVVLGWNEAVIPLLVVVSLIAATTYDSRRLGRVHPATAIGSAIILASLAVAPLGTSQIWINLMDVLAGNWPPD